MSTKKVSEINEYVGSSVNPMATPNQIYELYSVPSFEMGSPEILVGSAIGSTKNTVKEGDILICKINPRINRVWVVHHNTEYPLLASSEWIVVRTSSMNPEYLKWYFSSPRFRALLTSQVTGIGGSLTRAQPKQVANYPVPTTSRKEQDIIAAILTQIEVLICKRKQQIEELNQLVKSRFVELFGDPINNTMGLKTMRLSEACYLKAGITTAADAIHEQSADYPVPCYGGNGIRGYVRKATQRGCYPIIGRQGALCGNVQMATGEFHATEHAVLVTPLIETNVVWLFHLLKMMDLYRFHTGAAQPGLAVKTLNTVDIPVAEIAAQNRFAAFVEQTDKSKYYSSLSAQYCRMAANRYRQEWMTCRTSHS